MTQPFWSAVNVGLEVWAIYVHYAVQVLLHLLTPDDNLEYDKVTICANFPQRHKLYKKT